MAKGNMSYFQGGPSGEQGQTGLLGFPFFCPSLILFSPVPEQALITARYLLTLLPGHRRKFTERLRRKRAWKLGVVCAWFV
jgi:hypothetical protein